MWGGARPNSGQGQRWDSGMEPGKDQEKGSAARCPTSPAAGEGRGLGTPIPTPNTEGQPGAPSHATHHPLHTGTCGDLPCCLPPSGGWWEGWGGQSTLGTTGDPFYLCLKTLKLILETMIIITQGQGCPARRSRDSREGTAPWPAW